MINPGSEIIGVPASEIMDILERLEKDNANLEGSKKDYERLLLLNDHVDNIFKSKLRGIHSTGKKK